MMIKKSHDEIWFWHLKIEQFYTSGMQQKQYCEAYEIDYKKFCNMRYRIEYKKTTHPKIYNQMILITRKYMASGFSAAKFAKAHDIEIRTLSEMVTHLGYVDIIEGIKLKKEEEPMKFVQVPGNLSLNSQMVTVEPAQSAEHEVVEKQNDLEIIIAKGVKVSISPNIDSMKIIKIIELLKDL